MNNKNTNSKENVLKEDESSFVKNWCLKSLKNLQTSMEGVLLKFLVHNWSSIANTITLFIATNWCSKNYAKHAIDHLELLVNIVKSLKFFLHAVPELLEDSW